MISGDLGASLRWCVWKLGKNYCVAAETSEDKKAAITTNTDSLNGRMRPDGKVLITSAVYWTKNKVINELNSNSAKVNNFYNMARSDSWIQRYNSRLSKRWRLYEKLGTRIMCQQNSPPNPLQAPKTLVGLFQFHVLSVEIHKLYKE